MDRMVTIKGALGALLVVGCAARAHEVPELREVAEEPVVELAALVPPAVAAAECRPSPSGARSVDTRLSARAGYLCIHTVHVYAGSACEGTPEWSIDLACSQTSRLAITDRGLLISILAPRARSRDWAILSVIDRNGVSPRSGSLGSGVRLRLRDLPDTEALRGAARVDFDGASVRFRGNVEVRVAFDRIEALVAVESRRP